MFFFFLLDCQVDQIPNSKKMSSSERIHIGPTERLSFKDQWKQIYSSDRIKKGADILKARAELDSFVQFRRANPKVPKGRLINEARTRCPYVSANFPQLYQWAINVRQLKLDDFEEIMKSCFDLANSTVSGAIPNSKASNIFCNKILPKKTYKRTDGGETPNLSDSDSDF